MPRSQSDRLLLWERQVSRLRCARCFDLETQNEILLGQIRELRLQALEMAKYLQDFKAEMRACLDLKERGS